MTSPSNSLKTGIQGEITHTIDFLTVTTKDHESVIRHPRLPLQYTPSEKGFLGYDMVIDFMDKRREAQSSKRRDMGRMMTYSGDALRNAHAMGVSPFEVLGFHVLQGHRITRIDAAIDAYNTGLEVGKLWGMVLDKTCVTNSKSFYHAEDEGEGETVYIGYRKPKQVRIYNKAAEQKIADADWKRIELQYRKEYAVQAGSIIQKDEGKRESIQGLVKAFVDFPKCDVWTNIVNARSIKVRESEKGESKTMQWLLGDAAKAAAKLFLDGHTDVLDKFVESVMNEVSKKVDTVEEFNHRRENKSG